MIQTLKDYLTKTFTIQNILSRLFQFVMAILVAMLACILASRNGQIELVQGFYSGAVFVFMLGQLNGVFRK